MEIWQIICVLVVLVLVAFNPKVQLTKIFVEQFKVYTNDKTRKISPYDIVSFIVVPIVLSVIVALSLPYEEMREGFVLAGTWDLDGNTLSVTVEGETETAETRLLEGERTFVLKNASGESTTLTKM